MKQTLISLIAAAGIMLSTASCAPITTVKRVSQLEREVAELQAEVHNEDVEEELVMQGIRDINNATYQLHTSAAYTDGKQTQRREWSGSAWAFAKKDGYTYLITIVHVGLGRQVIPQLFSSPLQKVPGSEYVEIIREGVDCELNYNVPLEPVAISPTGRDAMVFRTKAFIPISTLHGYADVPPELGEDAFVFGFPLAGPKAYTSGVVSNELIVGSDGKPYHYVNADIQPGNSGGPVFVERDGTLEFAGITTLCLYRGGCVGYDFVTPFFEIEDLINLGE